MAKIYLAFLAFVLIQYGASGEKISSALAMFLHYQLPWSRKHFAANLEEGFIFRFVYQVWNCLN